MIVLPGVRFPLWGQPPVAAHPVQTGTRSRAACESSPEGTKENSPGFKPGD